MDQLEDAEKVLKEGLELAITRPFANDEDLKSQIRSEIAQIKRKDGIISNSLLLYKRKINNILIP